MDGSLPQQLVITCSADHIIRVMRMSNKRGKINNIEIHKPDEVQLFPYLDEMGGVADLCPDHPLNNKSFKSKMI